jgi:hypothetical protein
LLSSFTEERRSRRLRASPFKTAEKHEDKFSPGLVKNLLVTTEMKFPVTLTYAKTKNGSAKSHPEEEKGKRKKQKIESHL